MSDKSFFEELDKKLGKEDNDFSYKPTSFEKEDKGFPVILIVLAVVFVAVAVILFGELLSRGEKTNEAILPKTTQELTVESEGEKTKEDITDADLKDAEKALETAPVQENVKPEITKREVPTPKVEKKVKQIKAPAKIKTGASVKTIKKQKEIAKPVPSGWQVQLAAVSSKKSAENEWTRLKKRHPLLSSQKYAIFEKTIHGRILYRLRVVGMSSRNSADNLCSDLQTEGLSCLVVE